MTEPTQTEDQSPPSGAMALMRMVDFRIPLAWLLGGFIVAVGILTNMFFKLEQVSESLRELQVTVKAGNAIAASVSGELALLKYRVDTIENERKAAAAQGK